MGGLRGAPPARARNGCLATSSERRSARCPNQRFERVTAVDAATPARPTLAPPSLSCADRWSPQRTNRRWRAPRPRVPQLLLNDAEITEGTCNAEMLAAIRSLLDRNIRMTCAVNSFEERERALLGCTRRLKVSGCHWSIPRFVSVRAASACSGSLSRLTVSNLMGVQWRDTCRRLRDSLPSRCSAHARRA
jgi:hypothetical protein